MNKMNIVFAGISVGKGKCTLAFASEIRLLLAFEFVIINSVKYAVWDSSEMS
jgi:hypothetical protein